MRRNVMYSFKYQGIGESGKVHTLKVNVESLYVTCVYDNINNSLEYELDEFCELSKDYNNNYGSGKKYLERKVFQKVPAYLLAQENFVELFRTFMRHTYLIFHVNLPEEKKPEDYYSLEIKVSKNIEHLLNDSSKKTIISDFLHLDWTGDMSIQPQFFFIPKSLLEEKDNLDDLYSLRLLYKFLLITNNKISFETYFVPITVPEIPWYKNIKSLSTWRKIVKSINKQIKDMTEDK